MLFLTKKPLFCAIILLVFASIEGRSQALDSYIKEGLVNNIVLQQKKIALEQAMYSLKAANSFFLPSTNFTGSYSTGAGGRTISLPIGDLLNPVYSTLNTLTESNEFPQVENVEESFFPHDFYDLRVRTTLPLVNHELIYNKNIKSMERQLQAHEVMVYKRELVKNIKSAYFNYLSALSAQEVYENAYLLVTEHVRVNESLLREGKLLPAELLRAQSEAEKVKSQVNSAENQVVNARYYFNFLLNKDLGAPIEVENLEEADLAEVFLSSDNTGIQLREELKMVDLGSNISESALKMNKSFMVPKVNAFLDLGMQNSNWKFDTDSRYYLLGIQIDIPIFNGGRNNYAIAQSALELQKSDLSKSNLQKQLELSATVAANELSTVFQNYQSALSQLKSAQSYFKLIDRGYREGMHSQIQLLDARTQFTSAQLQVNISKYQVMLAWTNLERETASYSITY